LADVIGEIQVPVRDEAQLATVLEDLGQVLDPVDAVFVIARIIGCRFVIEQIDFVASVEGELLGFDGFSVDGHDCRYSSRIGSHGGFLLFFEPKKRGRASLFQ